MKLRWRQTRLKYHTVTNVDIVREADLPETFGYVDLSSVDWAGGDTNARRTGRDEAPSRARLRVLPGDVLVPSLVRARESSLNALAIGATTCDDIYSTGFHAVRAASGTDPRFLYWRLQGVDVQYALASGAEGTFLAAFTASDLGNLHVALPPIDEQRAIAAFLDRETAEIDDLVAKQEALIETLRERRWVVVEDAVHHGMNDIRPRMKATRVGWLAASLDHLRIPMNAEERASHQGAVPYWGANTVQDHVDRALVDGEVVLVGEDGAPFFNRNRPVAFYVDGPIWPNNHVHVLRTRPNCEPRWLSHALNCVDYTLYVDGATRGKLTQSSLMSIALPDYTRDEQRRIADYLDEQTVQIDSLIAKAEEFIAVARERRAALITAAVTGQLDVQPTLESAA